MRRVLVWCSVWVVVGALLNVGVAWVCVAMAFEWDLGRWSRPWALDDVQLAMTAEMRAGPVSATHFEVRRYTGVSRHISQLSVGTDAVTQTGYATTLRAGFPFESLAMREIKVYDGGRRVTGGWMLSPTWFDRPLVLSHHPLEVGPIVLRMWEFPKRPLPFGFVANTLVYALPMLCVVVWRGVRRWRWARRELCVGCGYDWGGVARCPECGLER